MSVSISSNLSWVSLLPILTRHESKQKICKAETKESEPFVLQMVKKHYTQAEHDETYRISNRSLKYDYTVSSYIAKQVKKVKSQMKAYFFVLKDPVSITGFLASSKFAYDNTNNIDEEAAIWVPSHYVMETLANTSDSRICA